MSERFKGLGDWVKEHKRSIAVYGLVAATAAYGLTGIFSRPGETGNASVKHPFFQEGLSLRVGSTWRSVLLSYTVGRSPISCPDGREVNSSFNTYGLRLSASDGLEVVHSSPVLVAPALACR